MPDNSSVIPQLSSPMYYMKLSFVQPGASPGDYRWLSYSVPPPSSRVEGRRGMIKMFTDNSRAFLIELLSGVTHTGGIAEIIANTRGAAWAWILEHKELNVFFVALFFLYNTGCRI